MRRANQASLLLVLIILGSTSLSFTQSAYAIVPVVQIVTVFDADGNTYLNVTVMHTPEIEIHYVNLIEVIIDSNTTDLTIGVQQLRPDNTFVITYDVGPVTGTPTATVRAHCTFNGWSSSNWIGPIPEFSMMPLVLFLVTIASMTTIFLRKRNNCVVRARKAHSTICQM